MAKRLKINPPDGTGSLILGLLLTVLGAGVFLERVGVRVWEYIWRLWPLLLIIMGGKTLLDHYHKQRPPKEQS